ncbi:MAG: hypothetical protein LBM75_02435 [Myxococcales bacterium]|jgi:hypothetical protein|nr:hypothetical protein [Myxococcales bacterium]
MTATANRTITLQGTIRREDLSGGYMVLVAEPDGRRYLLGGATKALREEGLRVEIEGELLADGGPSIAITSEPLLRVTSSRRL